jgi:hypothetical protein
MASKMLSRQAHEHVCKVEALTKLQEELHTADHSQQRGQSMSGGPIKEGEPELAHFEDVRLKIPFNKTL